MKRSLFILLVLLTLAAPAPGQDPATPDEAALRSAIGVRQQTQQARDQWAGEREALAARLDGLSGKKEELAARKARLAGEVESLSRAVARQEASTAEVAGLSGSLSPLVSEMR
ncbi:MAG: DUF3450 domain-containing protein, partial [Proteobacteria bacterium]|nr:DUF3450 domain-containing protein [Pseudomonadota bacterium]